MAGASAAAFAAACAAVARADDDRVDAGTVENPADRQDGKRQAAVRRRSCFSLLHAGVDMRPDVGAKRQDGVALIARRDGRPLARTSPSGCRAPARYRRSTAMPCRRAIGDDVALGVAPQQIVAELVDGDGRDLRDLAHLRDREIADPDRRDLALRAAPVPDPPSPGACRGRRAASGCSRGRWTRLRAA